MILKKKITIYAILIFIVAILSISIINKPIYAQAEDSSIFGTSYYEQNGDIYVICPIPTRNNAHSIYSIGTVAIVDSNNNVIAYWDYGGADGHATHVGTNQIFLGIRKENSQFYNIARKDIDNANISYTWIASYNYYFENCSGGTATCTNKAKCSKCNLEYGSALGHNGVSKKVSDATCTSAAIYHDVCSRCGIETRGRYNSGNALGHVDNNTWITDVNPTCTTIGRKHTNCSRCGAIMNANTQIDAYGHNWSWIRDTNATCTVDGTQHQHCSNCGANQNYNTIWQKALGHAYDAGKIITYPTVYKDGLKIYTCSRCKDTNTAIEPQYHFNIYVGYTQIKRIAKGANLLFENTSMDANLIPFVSK